MSGILTSVPTVFGPFPGSKSDKLLPPVHPSKKQAEKSNTVAIIPYLNPLIVFPPCQVKYLFLESH
jgi:hypothetical protein